MQESYDIELTAYSDVAPSPLADRAERLDRAQEFLNAALERARSQSEWLWDSFVAEDWGFQLSVIAPAEVFSTLLIAESLDESDRRPRAWRALLRRIAGAFTSEGLVHFFEDRELLPADLDCTSLAWDIALRHIEDRPCDPQRTIDIMARNVDAVGVVRVYATDDPARGARVDPTVCVNVLHLAYTLGRERDFGASERYVEEFLRSDECLRGTRYYPSAELFFLFLSRLVADFAGPRHRFGDVLRRRLEERLGTPASNSLERAARVIVASRLGLDASYDLVALGRDQRPDGSWPAAPCFRYGRTPRYFGGEALTTALCMHAIASAHAAKERHISDLSSCRLRNAARTQDSRAAG